MTSQVGPPAVAQTWSDAKHKDAGDGELQWKLVTRLQSGNALCLQMRTECQLVWSAQPCEVLRQVWLGFKKKEKQQAIQLAWLFDLRPRYTEFEVVCVATSCKAEDVGLKNKCRIIIPG